MHTASPHALFDSECWFCYDGRSSTHAHVWAKTRTHIHCSQNTRALACMLLTLSTMMYVCVGREKHDKPAALCAHIRILSLHYWTVIRAHMHADWHTWVLARAHMNMQTVRSGNSEHFDLYRFELEALAATPQRHRRIAQNLPHVTKSQ